MDGAFADITDWAKRLNEEDYGELEVLINSHTATVEMQGFVYGFRYGVQIMTECLLKGGASNG